MRKARKKMPPIPSPFPFPGWETWVTRERIYFSVISSLSLCLSLLSVPFDRNPLLPSLSFPVLSQSVCSWCCCRADPLTHFFFLPESCSPCSCMTREGEREEKVSTARNPNLTTWANVTCTRMSVPLLCCCLPCRCRLATMDRETQNPLLSCFWYPRELCSLFSFDPVHSFLAMDSGFSR